MRMEQGRRLHSSRIMLAGGEFFKVQRLVGGGDCGRMQLRSRKRPVVSGKNVRRLGFFKVELSNKYWFPLDKPREKHIINIRQYIHR